ncbi:disintegrin and metalloproteinase domain-containing protein 20-like [Cervus elaphus]|uniref:disintegrin and metalloproteinase domain-containing protein 20-like n=1 Tax=Cervus elaphus TaxID=9860 RepID=UPI001CC27715|nr:disintegrin and metalloproteinase domain-containing protein 20-like [Cervus elaphus]
MLAEGGVTLRAALWLLGLWAVLAAVQCSPDRPSWRYISTEVVIPRKEPHQGKGAQVLGWLSYSLRFGGQRHLIRMRRKRLFWPGYLMMTQDDQGVLQTDHPFVPEDCYYFGYLEETPFSMVTMNTCYGGLQGYMKLDDLTYEISPLKHSQKFEHAVSQMVVDTNVMGRMHRPGYEEERDPLLSPANITAGPRLSSKLFFFHVAHIKALVQSTNAFYRTVNNVSTAAQYMVEVGNIIDAVYRGLEMRFYISVLHVFDVMDPVNTESLRQNSPYFNFYETFLSRFYRSHTGIVFNTVEPPDGAAMPNINSFCHGNNLIAMATSGKSILRVALYVCFLLGRSIGLYYDSDNCVCQRRTTCIMNVYQSLTDAFSNCSYMHLTRVYTGVTSDCMFDPRLAYYNKSITNERCGNGEVESGEQCDCGSFKECYNNPCCDSLCSWTARSNCDAEACCTNCTFSKPGMLCRPIQSICDLPEYCRGVSKTCPKDVFMQDGTPCGEEGYCFNGSCTDRNVHCKEIFGRGAFNAPNSCYILNRGANRFGHCRRIPTSLGYIACRIEDQLCGRLQCTNVTSLPRLQEHVAFHQTHLSGFLCFGLDLHRGTGTVDVGRVREGTLCGDGMYCLNTFCNSSVSKIEYTCPPQKCSFRGVCNSEDHCHCHVGWAPPLCKTMGKGGSADSGPPPNLFRSVPYDETILIYLRLVFARLYALTAALLFGVATNVKTIQTSKIKEETVKPV